MKNNQWKDKIRKDYSGILSEKQIEATIKYWDDFLEQAIKEGYEKGIILGRMEGYKKGTDDTRKEERALLREKIEKMKKSESEIPCCENCGEDGFHKVWYGRGAATHDNWGDRYYPTGSVVLCEKCKKEIREWDGEEIWRWTSDLPEHKNRRINEITEKLPQNIAFNQALDDILKLLT